jgi:uridine phosphorylase
LGEGDVEEVVYICGDPNRVPLIASKMKDASELARYRGFISYRAFTPKGVPVTVTTSGIGTPSMHIALEEVTTLGAKCIIRVGTCGGVDPKVSSGDVVVPYAAVRDEFTSSNYAPLAFPAVASLEVYSALYEAAQQLLPKSKLYTGICWTSDIFYEFRESDRLVQWTRLGVKCIEMESSLLFVFAQARGIRAGSILACDGNLHRDPKGEQAEAELSGEQNPLLKEAIETEIAATIRATDVLFSS